jgi:hypothetical protein
MATQTMTSPPTAIIAAAHARSMSAGELGDFIVSECKEICTKLASLKPYVEIAFERIDAGETICGYTSKTAFCIGALGKTYNAVKFMLAGGNPRNGRTVFNEVQTEVIAALASQGCEQNEADSLDETANGDDSNSLFKSALAKRSGLMVIPESAPEPVPTTVTAPAPEPANVNVVASELIRDLESASRLKKLEAVVESRQYLNPTIWKNLLLALNNANKNIADFEAQLSKDFEGLPYTGKAHQRLLERKPAQPNKYTFTIPPIKVLVAEEMNGGVWCDPFAGMTSPAQVKNDLNPEANAEFHMDALEFLKAQPSGYYDGILYDPPYSFRQASECYKKYGRERMTANVTNMKY